VSAKKVRFFRCFEGRYLDDPARGGHNSDKYRCTKRLMHPGHHFSQKLSSHTNFKGAWWWRLTIGRS
jgi:hypothetical protein